ncbi:hypothetical protein AZI86_11350 [Bdellovibrio bacteriovorus]|uniref:Peptidase S74 domain-containing protein n=1 Tax=Bdellovibrio bacteriovorus TaxID=959 RepID=A0A150WM60_BDEBC|nr:tail fiber domain-containing protein [Bdellovibrio bacteriovorus]KYG64793.1 hypothetical protein AZI86_11350 [Bdellovibrio bacteriovorus]
MNSVINLGTFWIGILVTFYISFVNAAPTTFSYQGRIVKSDNKPLQYHSVSFEFRITNPNGACVLYREQVSGIDMSNSNGIFDIPIGLGTKLFPLSSSFNLLDAFENAGTLNCEGGATYSPLSTDGRLLRVQFHDGSGWKLIAPDNIIRSVPFAAFAGKSGSSSMLGTKTEADFVLKSSIPTCGTGYVLTSTSSGILSCALASAGSGSGVSSIAASSPLSVADLGSGSYSISANVGTTAGTLAAGNDSRITNAMQTGATAGGDLSGTYPNPNVAKIQNIGVTFTSPASGQFLKYNGSQWVNATLSSADLPSGTASATGTAGAIPYFSATNTLSDSLIFQSSGRIGIGTTTPAFALDVVGDLNITGSILQGSSRLLHNYTASGTTGKNIFVGIGSGNTTMAYSSNVNNASLNTGLGADTLKSLTTGRSNVAIGTGATTSVTTGSYNVAVGVDTLSVATSAGWSTALGYKALSATTSGTSNSAMGAYALSANTTGLDNVSVGASSMLNTTTGSFNTALGGYSLGSSGTGDSNTAVGHAAMQSKSGALNTVLGKNAAKAPGSINNAVILGAGAGDVQSGSTGNILVGYQAGKTITSGSYNILLGYDIDTPAVTTNNFLNIGNMIYATNLGTGSTAATGNVGIGVTSPTEKLDVNGKVKATEFCIGGSCISSWPSGGGSGTVTNIATGTGLTGGPITATGTISIANGGVGTTQLADGAVTQNKLETVSGLTAGAYGSATAIPAITVDAKGRVTAISTNAITGLPAASGVSGKFLKSNGTAWSGQDILFSDIKNSVGGSAFNVASCAANQTVAWSSLTDSFTCQGIGSLDASAITTGTLDVARLPASVTDGVWAASSGNVYRSSGNVGIGTSSPISPLHVTGQIRSDLGLSVTSAGNIYKDASSNLAFNSATNVINFTNSALTSTYMTIASGKVGIGETNPAHKLSVKSLSQETANTDIAAAFSYMYAWPTTSSAGRFIGQFNGVENGNTAAITGELVGQANYVNNLTSPAINKITGSWSGVKNRSGGGAVATATGFQGEIENLSASTVTTAMGVQSSVTNSGSGAITNAYGLYVGDVQGTNKWSVYASDTSALNYFGGFVGIGNTTPTVALTVGSTVNGNGTILINRQNTGGNEGGEIQFAPGTNGEDNFVIDSYLAGANQLLRLRSTTNNSILNLSKTGNVGFGTATPKTRMHLKQVADNYTGGFVMEASGSSSGWNMFSNGAGTSLIFSYAGDVSNIDNFAGQHKMYVTTGGNMWIAGTLSQASDIRLKKDITPISDALNKITQLNGVTYNWKNPAADQDLQMGLIAQEVQKVFPEAVKENSDGFLSVSYSNLVAPIIQSIKELFSRSQEQEREIASLKEDNKEMKKALCELGKTAFCK